MSILSSIVSAAGQIAVFTTNTFSIGFRSLRVYQAYQDPNIGSISRWASIALNTISVAAQTASCSSSLEDKQIEQLTAISNTTSLGADVIYVMGDENASITNKALLIAKFLSATNQARGGKKDLSDFVHIAEAVIFCYENKDRIAEQMQELKNKRKVAKRKRARAATGSFDSKKEYQELLSNCRKEHPNKTDLSIFLLVRGCIIHEGTEIEFNQKECKAIVGGVKVTDLKKIPYILKDDFQDRICDISKKPVYKVVAIRKSADDDPIYYEWSNLVKAVQNEKAPKNWPKTVLFGPEEVVVDHLETKNIRERLKKAALKPNIARRAQAALKQLDKRKKFLESMKELSLADIIGCKIDKECIKLIGSPKQVVISSYNHK